MRPEKFAHNGLLIKVYPYARVCATHLRTVSLASKSDDDLSEAYEKASAKLVYAKVKAGNPTASFVWQHMSNRPIESTNRTNLRRDRKRRGTRGFTAANRHKVKSCAALLEQSYGQRRIVFLTATLPSAITSPDPAQWSYAVRLFRDRLRAELLLKALPDEIVGVVEIQEKRFRATGDVCPHIHLAFVGRHAGQNWAIHHQRYMEMWRDSLLVAFPGLSSDEYFGSCTSVQGVRKSLVNYLGKYMSKGSKVIREMESKSKSHLIPSSWVICSRTMHNRYKQSVRTLSGKAAERYLEMLRQSASRCIAWEKDICVPSGDGHFITVGWTASLTAYGYKKTLGMLRPKVLPVVSEAQETYSVVSTAQQCSTNVLQPSTAISGKC